MAATIDELRGAVLMTFPHTDDTAFSYPTTSGLSKEDAKLVKDSKHQRLESAIGDSADAKEDSKLKKLAFNDGTFYLDAQKLNMDHAHTIMLTAHVYRRLDDKDSPFRVMLKQQNESHLFLQYLDRIFDTDWWKETFEYLVGRDEPDNSDFIALKADIAEKQEENKLERPSKPAETKTDNNKRKLGIRQTDKRKGGNKKTKVAKPDAKGTKKRQVISSDSEDSNPPSPTKKRRVDKDTKKKPVHEQKHGYPKKRYGQKKKVADKSGDKYVIHESDIHGLGLFAARDIEKDEDIVQYTGEVIDQARFDELYPVKYTATYVAFLPGGMYIDAVDPDKSGDGRYVNTAGPGRPGNLNNSCFVIKKDPANPGNYILWIRSRRFIKKGSEILVPYGRSFRFAQQDEENKLEKKDVLIPDSDTETTNKHTAITLSHTTDYLGDKDVVPETPIAGTNSEMKEIVESVFSVILGRASNSPFLSTNLRSLDIDGPVKIAAGSAQDRFIKCLCFCYKDKWDGGVIDLKRSMAGLSVAIYEYARAIRILVGDDEEQTRLAFFQQCVEVCQADPSDTENIQKKKQGVDRLIESFALNVMYTRTMRACLKTVSSKANGKWAFNERKGGWPRDPPPYPGISDYDERMLTTIAEDATLELTKKGIAIEKSIIKALVALFARKAQTYEDHFTLILHFLAMYGDPEDQTPEDVCRVTKMPVGKFMGGYERLLGAIVATHWDEKSDDDGDNKVDTDPVNNNEDADMESNHPGPETYLGDANIQSESKSVAMSAHELSRNLNRTTEHEETFGGVLSVIDEFWASSTSVVIDNVRVTKEMYLECCLDCASVAHVFGAMPASLITPTTRRSTDIMYSVMLEFRRFVKRRLAENTERGELSGRYKSWSYLFSSMPSDVDEEWEQSSSGSKYILLSGPMIAHIVERIMPDSNSQKMYQWPTDVFEGLLDPKSRRPTTIQAMKYHKRVDIESDTILVPYNKYAIDGRAGHWALLVFDIPRNVVVHTDSYTSKLSPSDGLVDKIHRTIFLVNNESSSNFEYLDVVYETDIKPFVDNTSLSDQEDGLVNFHGYVEPDIRNPLKTAQQRDKVSCGYYVVGHMLKMLDTYRRRHQSGYVSTTIDQIDTSFDTNDVDGFKLWLSHCMLSGELIYTPPKIRAAVELVMGINDPRQEVARMLDLLSINSMYLTNKDMDSKRKKDETRIRNLNVIVYRTIKVRSPWTMTLALTVPVPQDRRDFINTMSDLDEFVGRALEADNTMIEIPNDVPQHIAKRAWGVRVLLDPQSIPLPFNQFEYIEKVSIAVAGQTTSYNPSVLRVMFEGDLSPSLWSVQILQRERLGPVFYEDYFEPAIVPQTTIQLTLANVSFVVTVPPSVRVLSIKRSMCVPETERQFVDILRCWTDEDRDVESALFNCRVFECPGVTRGDVFPTRRMFPVEKGGILVLKFMYDHIELYLNTMRDESKDTIESTRGIEELHLSTYHSIATNHDDDEDAAVRAIVRCIRRMLNKGVFIDVKKITFTFQSVLRSGSHILEDEKTEIKRYYEYDDDETRYTTTHLAVNNILNDEPVSVLISAVPLENVDEQVDFIVDDFSQFQRARMNHYNVDAITMDLLQDARAQLIDTL